MSSIRLLDFTCKGSSFLTKLTEVTRVNILIDLDNIKARSSQTCVTSANFPREREKFFAYFVRKRSNEICQISYFRWFVCTRKAKISSTFVAAPFSFCIMSVVINLATDEYSFHLLEKSDQNINRNLFCKK